MKAGLAGMQAVAEAVEVAGCTRALGPVETAQRPATGQAALAPRTEETSAAAGSRVGEDCTPEWAAAAAVAADVGAQAAWAAQTDAVDALAAEASTHPNHQPGPAAVAVVVSTGAEAGVGEVVDGRGHEGP